MYDITSKLDNINSLFEDDDFNICVKTIHAELSHSLFKRRFIWYIYRTLFGTNNKLNYKLGGYLNIANSLFVKNRIVNNKLLLYNFNKVADLYLSSEQFFFNLSSPIIYNKIYGTSGLDIYIYFKSVRMDDNVKLFLYYRKVPFTIKNEGIEYLLNYESLSLFHKKTNSYYVTYYIGNLHESNEKIYSFIRCKLYDDAWHDRILSDLLDKILCQSSTDKVELSDETAWLYDYLYVGKKRYRNQLKFDIFISSVKYHSGVLFYAINTINVIKFTPRLQ